MEDSKPNTTPNELLTVDAEVNHLGFGRFHLMALAVLGLANASDAVELLCLSFILPLLDGSSSSNGKCGGVDEPTHPGDEYAATYTTQNKALLSSGIFFGMLVGGLVFGVGADRWGRRVTLCVSLAINAAFGLLSSVTKSFWVLLACRVLAGFGVGGSIPGVFTLAAELLPEKDRGFWLSTVAWWWMVGSVYAAGAAWAMLGVGKLPWQTYAAVCTIPAAVASALIFFLLPESPRFLHSKGDSAGAAQALATIAAWNRRPTRLSQGWVLREGVDQEDAERGSYAQEEAGTTFASSSSSSAASAAASTGSAGGVELLSSVSSSKSARGASEPSSAALWALGVSPSPGESGSGSEAEGAGFRGPGGSEQLAIRSAASKAEAEGESQGLLGFASPSQGAAPNGAALLSSSQKGTACGKLIPRDLCGTVMVMFEPQNRRVSIILSYVWFALSFGWYGLILWIPTLFCNANVDLDAFQVRLRATPLPPRPPRAQQRPAASSPSPPPPTTLTTPSPWLLAPQDSFLVAASNLPGNILSGLLMDRVGRKGILASSLVAACISAICFRYANSEVTVVLAACVLNAVSTCSWNSLDCLSTESFPTGLRTTALGMLAAMGRLGSIAGQFVFGSLAENNTNELLILSGIVLGTGALASLALPTFKFKD